MVLKGNAGLRGVVVSGSCYHIHTLFIIALQHCLHSYNKSYVDFVYVSYIDSGSARAVVASNIFLDVSTKQSLNYSCTDKRISNVRT